MLVLPRGGLLVTPMRKCFISEAHPPHSWRIIRVKSLVLHRELVDLGTTYYNFNLNTLRRHSLWILQIALQIMGQCEIFVVFRAQSRENMPLVIKMPFWAPVFRTNAGRSAMLLICWDEWLRIEHDTFMTEIIAVTILTDIRSRTASGPESWKCVRSGSTQQQGTKLLRNLHTKRDVFSLKCRIQCKAWVKYLRVQRINVTTSVMTLVLLELT